MDSTQELLPLVLSKDGSEKLMFYREKTDQLFLLKDAVLHNRLQMFGTFREIHLSEDDIVFDCLLQSKIDCGWRSRKLFNTYSLLKR